MDAIDVHTHILPPGWEDYATRFGGDRWPRLLGDPATRCQLYIGPTFNRNDSLTHSPRALALVLETFGRERVVLGSDYPFRMGTDDPVAALEPAGLEADLRRLLLHDNARAFLGLA